MDTIIIIAAIAFIVVIGVLIFVKRKPKPTPTPTPNPTPVPTPVPTAFFYNVNVYEVGTCRPLATMYISNLTNLDDQVGKFYYSPDDNAVLEIVSPEYGDPARETNFYWPGAETCSQVPIY